MRHFMALLLTVVLLGRVVWADVSATGIEQSTRQQALSTMQATTRYFRGELASHGGYLWQYSQDLSLREGEVPAPTTTIWVQPPGTPSVGMAFLDAWTATGDTLYLHGAVEAARALVWGQLASGGWYYRIEFEHQGESRWHYRREVVAGDTVRGDRRNSTVFDDDTSQSALRLLMRVDAALGFRDSEIRDAVDYALRAFLQAQYPNGAWPQRYLLFPDPSQHEVRSARYPDTWSRDFPSIDYRDYYTFNDNAVVDVIDVMLEAHRTYRDERYLAAALRGGDFILLAQMPEPQPAWAQQYNQQMEPAWGRRFEPPSITGSESFGVLHALLNLYIETGEARFLTPIQPALDWARRSLLPDGRLARFYELQTNRPLYFVRDTYEMTYSDADMPTHYNFKVKGLERIRSVEKVLQRLEEQGREAVLARRRQRDSGSLTDRLEAQARAIIAAVDAQGRFVEAGHMKPAEYGDEPIVAQVIRCQTFIRNLRTLSRYVALAAPASP